MTCGVYLIINVVNGKRYVGSSIHIERRIECHSRALRNGKHGNKHLQSAYNMYGEDNFEYDILTVCEKDMLSVCEQQFLDAFVPEYNMIMSGERPPIQSSEFIRQRMLGNKHFLGHTHSKEARKKIGDAHKGNQYWKGRHHSLATCMKMSNIMKGNTHCLGNKHPDETKKRISVSHVGNQYSKGYKHSEEWKKKMSELNKGKKMSEDTKRKMSIAQRKRFGN